MYNSHIEQTEAQASGEAVWENQEKSTDLLVAAGFDQSVKWITQRRITYEDVKEGRDIAKPVIEVLDFLDEMTPQGFKSSDNLKNYLLALLKGEMPEHLGSAPQLNVFDIPDCAAVEAITKANIPGGHASDRGIHLFTHDAKTLIHELLAFTGLCHRQSAAFEIVVEEWLRAKTQLADGNAQPFNISALLQQTQLSSKYSTRLAKDGEANNWFQGFEEIFRATDADLGREIYQRVFRPSDLLTKMKTNEVNIRDVALFGGLKRLVFGRKLPLCPHCLLPLEISYTRPNHLICSACLRQFSEAQVDALLGKKIPRKIRKINQELDQWEELYDRRLNQLIDEYVQNPRWEDIETARATWERLLEAIKELNSKHGPISMDPKYSFTIIDKRKAKLVSNLSNADSTGKTRIENEIRKLNTLLAGHPLARFIAEHTAKQTSPTREGQQTPSQKVDQEAKAIRNLAQRAKWDRKEKAKSTQKPVRTSKQSSVTKASAPATVQDGIRNALANLGKALRQHGGEELRRAAEEYLISVGCKRSLPAIERRMNLLKMKTSDKVKGYLYWRELDALRQLRARIEKRR